MMFTFDDGESLFIRKLPKQNIIEAKIAGKRLLYERSDEGLLKLTDADDPREPHIKERILQFFGSKKHSKGN